MTASSIRSCSWSEVRLHRARCVLSRRGDNDGRSGVCISRIANRGVHGRRWSAGDNCSRDDLAHGLCDGAGRRAGRRRSLFSEDRHEGREEQQKECGEDVDAQHLVCLVMCKVGLVLILLGRTSVTSVCG
jgi:hypothetical protein